MLERGVVADVDRVHREQAVQRAGVHELGVVQNGDVARELERRESVQVFEPRSRDEQRLRADRGELPEVFQSGSVQNHGVQRVGERQAREALQIGAVDEEGLEPDHLLQTGQMRECRGNPRAECLQLPSVRSGSRVARGSRGEAVDAQRANARDALIEDSQPASASMSA